MSSYFKIVSTIAHYDMDNWQTGCNPDTTKTIFDNSPRVGERYETAALLYRAIGKTHGVKISDIEINACDENGRLDVQYQCFSVGNMKPSSAAQFENGECDLYLCNISYYIQFVDSHPVLPPHKERRS